MEDTPKNLEVAELRLGPEHMPAPGGTGLVSSQRLGGTQTSAQPTAEGQAKLHNHERQTTALWLKEEGEKPWRKLAMNSTLEQVSHAPRESTEARTLHFRWQLRGGSANRLSQLQPTVKITLGLLLSSNRCLL